MIFVVVSTGHFDPLIEVCNRLSSKYSFLGQVGSSQVVPNFPHFKTASHETIENYMKEAELVISHGGAGMTAMLCRLKKKNIIIPKQVRYGEANNLQVELAQKWAQLGMTVFCKDVEDLESCLVRAKTFQYRFPVFPQLGQHILSLIDQGQVAAPVTT